MYNQELPEDLTHEGNLMLNSLLNDLLEIMPGNITITRDQRLTVLNKNVSTIYSSQDIWDIWKECFSNADIAFLIAPETNNVLYQLTKLAEDCGCFVMGCSLKSVSITGSKIRTLEYLRKANIPCVPTSMNNSSVPESENGWVVKPDDGVGGGDCFHFTDRQSLLSHINTSINKKSSIIQPYISGMPASISLLCNEGQAAVLGCNQQLFEFIDGKGHLSGLIVNGLIEHEEDFDQLANRITQTIPGLWGYIGVDLMITDNGPLVLEINPRLTTAYAGLHNSLNYNALKWLFDMQCNNRIPQINKLDVTPVTVNLEFT